MDFSLGRGGNELVIDCSSSDIKVAVGNYIRKGVPDFDTQFFVSICRKILADELKDGNISEEKHDRALKMLEREIQNGRVTVK